MTDDELIPLLRGVTHAYAFWFALAGAIALILLAPSATAVTAAAIYGTGLCALFAGSALYHRWRWDPRWRPLLRRVDHSTIFVFIAASYTPVALLVLHGALSWVVLAGVWTAALGGIMLSVAWITAPRWVTAAAYLLVGWMALIAVPSLVRALPAAPLLLLLAGGILYSAGATVYATQRPDPAPRVFGFHVVFHALVVAAAVAHFVAITGWVIPLL